MFFLTWSSFCLQALLCFGPPSLPLPGSTPGDMGGDTGGEAGVLAPNADKAPNNEAVEEGSKLQSFTGVGEGGEETLPKKPSPDLEDAERLRLVSRLLFGDQFYRKTGLFIDGWIQQSYFLNPYSPASGFNGPVVFMDRSDRYLMNQLYFRMGRQVDPNRGVFDVGGQVDLLYGTDAVFVQAFGLDQDIVTGSDDYRLAIPQCYGEIFVPMGEGLSIKAGHFYTPIGNESVASTLNFFPTMQYAANYAQPFTHTGVLATQKLTSTLSLQAGVVRGVNSWNDNNNALTFLGGASWTSENQKSSIAIAGLSGPEQDEPRRPFRNIVAAEGESLNQFQYCLVVKQKLGERLRYVGQHDFGLVDGSESMGLSRPTRWFGVNQYLFFDANESVTWGVRGEWFRDDDGVLVVPNRASAVIGNLASASNYFALSVGANIRANPWMTVRPELRWDFQDRDDESSPRQFDDGRKSHQFLAGVDLIMRF